MNITIKITSAEQCFACIRQLLHYYPSLSLTITSDETIPTPARSAQANNHYLDTNSGGISPHCPCDTCKAGRVGAYPDSERTRTEAGLATDAAWARFKAESAARRAASEHAADEALRQADAIRRENIDRGNNREDLDYTDKP